LHFAGAYQLDPASDTMLNFADLRHIPFRMRVLIIGILSYYQSYPVLFDKPDDFFLIIAFRNEIVDSSTFRFGDFDEQFETFPGPAWSVMLFDACALYRGREHQQSTQLRVYPSSQRNRP
jgi:hypothetical protein